MSTFCKACALKFCKISGEITNFSCEVCWFFIGSPLTLAVKLHEFTASKKFQKDVWSFGVNFSSVFQKMCLNFVGQKNNSERLLSGEFVNSPLGYTVKLKNFTAFTVDLTHFNTFVRAVNLGNVTTNISGVISPLYSEFKISLNLKLCNLTATKKKSFSLQSSPDLCNFTAFIAYLVKFSTFTSYLT